MTPTTILRSLFSIAICASFTNINAQNLPWNPVPFGQTSYFQDSGTGEILSMECDGYFPGGAGEFYEICYNQMQAEFDSCAYAIWNDSWQPNPPADFRGYINTFGSISIEGKNELFTIPVNEPLNSWHFFGLNTVVKVGPVLTVSVLGTMDSVKTFDVYETDSSTVVGSISLSKNHGLTSFVPFKLLDGQGIDSSIVWELVGMENDSQAFGYAMPEGSDYFPYAVGDRILLKFSSYRNLGPNIWEPFTDLLAIDITQLDTLVYGISGVAARYDSMGFYMSTDSNFNFSFKLLHDMVDNPYSVPHISDLTGTQPYPSVIPSIPTWIESNGEVIANVGGYERDVCDSTIIVDGLALFQSYSSEYGFIYSNSSSLGGPPETYELCAAEGENFSFGTWPTLLSLDNVSDEVAVKMYPNPANDQLFISMPEASNAELIVWNMAGIQVMQSNISNGELDVSKLRSGIYFFQVSTEGARSTHRIVIQ